mmetsp:Transcript_13368/g.23670  ORF Transcript_13368/g.23670 Transcript_13368/m.23670 type:complete len:397 (-) Transcript_13368:108-1298(-)
MELSKDILEHAPVEGALSHVFTPVLTEGVVGSAEVVPGNLRAHVMGHVDVDVEAKELNPLGVVAVDSTRELGFGGIPLLGGHERDMGGSVMNNGNSAHPEVVAEPWHEPVLDDGTDSTELEEKGQGNEEESSDVGKGNQDAGALLLSVPVDIEMPNPPVTDRSKKLEGTSKEKLIEAGEVLHLLLHNRVPRGVLNKLVGVGVVVVVLDAPGLERIDEGEKHNMADNILDELVAMEGTMATVMANNEPASQSSAGVSPSKRKKVPGGNVNKVKAKEKGSDGDSNRSPGLLVVKLKNLGGKTLDNLSEGDIIREFLANAPEANLFGKLSTSFVIKVTNRHDNFGSGLRNNALGLNGGFDGRLQRGARSKDNFTLLHRGARERLNVREGQSHVYKYTMV